MARDETACAHPPPPAPLSTRFITYPRTNEDFIANMGVKNPLEYKFYGICSAACPAFLDVVCNYDFASLGTNEQKLRCMTDAPNTAPLTAEQCRSLKKNCWINAQETSSIMFRCIPVYNVTNNQDSTCIYPEYVKSAFDPDCIVVRDNKEGSVSRPAKPNLLFDQLNSARQVWGRWFGDLARAWWVILVCSVFLALVLGFTWVLLLKYFTACMVWTTIISVILLLACLTGFFYYKAGLINFTVPESVKEKLNSLPGKEAAASYVDEAKAYAATYKVESDWSSNMEQYGVSYKGMAYAFTGILMIVLCMVVALRGAIRTAVEVIKLGSDALRALPTLIFFPLTNVLAIGLFLVWWVFVAACLQSAGDATSADVAKTLSAGMAGESRSCRCSRGWMHRAALPAYLPPPPFPPRSHRPAVQPDGRGAGERDGLLLLLALDQLVVHRD